MSVETITVEVAVAAVEAQTFETYEGRRIHHCFLGGIGCDWDEADVIDLCRRAQEVFWSDTTFGRILGAEVGLKTYFFDSVRAPRVES